MDEYLLKEPNLAGYEFPDPHQCPVSEDIGEFVRRNQNRYRVVSIGFAVFERALDSQGYGKPADGYVSHPAFVDELIERIYRL